MRAPNASAATQTRGAQMLATFKRLPTQFADNLALHRAAAPVPAHTGVDPSIVVRPLGVRARGASPVSASSSPGRVPHPGFLAGRLGEDLCVYYASRLRRPPGVDAALIAQRDLDLAAAPTCCSSRRRHWSRASARSIRARSFRAWRGCRTVRQGAGSGDGTARAPPAICRGRWSVHRFDHDGSTVPLIEWLAGSGRVDIPSRRTCARRGRALRALPNVRLAGAQPYAPLRVVETSPPRSFRIA